MSSNYSAGQYNDAFSPKRLGNWEVSHTNYEQRPRIGYTTGLPTAFIANARGHLLPGVHRNEGASPWGDLQNETLSFTRLYKDPSELKSSIKSKRFPIPRFFKRKLPELDVHRPPAARKLIDPNLNYLRDLQLPVVWIVGLPSTSTLKFHKDFAKQLAKELNYFCIELDDQIVKWLNRQNESPQARRTILKVLEKSRKPPSSRRQRKVSFFNQQEQPKSQTRNEAKEDDTEPKIKFDTSAPFDTDKLLELLKFAMLEGLPSQGFVITGFPCNMEEAAEFEKQFYPPAVGLYMTSTINSHDANVVTTENGSRKKANLSGLNDPIEKPKHFTRTYSYSSKDITKVGQEYGKTVIRVIDAEEFERDKDMVTYMYEVVKKRIRRHLDELDGKIVDSDELESSFVTSTAASSSDVTLTSSPSDSDEQIMTDSVINLPPPLISCSVSSVSSDASTVPYIPPLRTFENSKSHSRESWNQQLESTESNIQSWIPIHPMKEVNADAEAEQEQKTVPLTSPISRRPSPVIKWEDPDDRPLPTIVSLRSGLSMEDETISTMSIDSGALGDRPSRVVEDPLLCIVNQRLIEEIDDWFESTRILRTAPTIEDSEAQNAERLDEEEIAKCDGDHGDAYENLKVEEKEEDNER